MKQKGKKEKTREIYWIYSSWSISETFGVFTIKDTFLKMSCNVDFFLITCLFQRNSIKLQIDGKNRSLKYFRNEISTQFE